MTKAEKVKSFALSRVGCPYLMGGTGQFCTVAYRKARAEQYPDYAGKIKANCPRMAGQATSCKGCRWHDDAAGQGKRAYDCAQLARAAMAEAGIKEVSGATSQWKKTKWAQRGLIADMPRDRLCQVFRADSAAVMGHTGIYLGDGTVVHAKGHDWGVVREELGKGNTFTHFGIPEGLYAYEGAPAPAPPEEGTEMQVYEITGTRVAQRAEPSAQAEIMQRIEKKMLVWGRVHGSDWIYVEFAGKAGYCMAQYLRLIGTEQENAQDDDGQTVRVDRALLEDLIRAANRVTEVMK